MYPEELAANERRLLEELRSINKFEDLLGKTEAALWEGLAKSIPDKDLYEYTEALSKLHGEADGRRCEISCALRAINSQDNLLHFKPKENNIHA